MIILDTEFKKFPIPSTINSTLIHYGRSIISVDWNTRCVRIRGFKGEIKQDGFRKTFKESPTLSSVTIDTENREIEIGCLYGNIVPYFPINKDQMIFGVYPEKRKPLHTINTPIKDEKVKKAEDFKMASLFGITSMGLLALALVATILGV